MLFSLSPVAAGRIGLGKIPEGLDLRPPVAILAEDLQRRAELPEGRVEATLCPVDGREHPTRIGLGPAVVVLAIYRYCLVEAATRLAITALIAMHLSEHTEGTGFPESLTQRAAQLERPLGTRDGPLVPSLGQP